MSAHPVCPVEELDPGERTSATVDGREIVVFNVDGDYRAYLNQCAHQAGPVCDGPLVDTVLLDDEGEPEPALDGYVLTCPWHGWEYDVRTGETIANIKKRLVSVDVSVEDDEVHVHV